MPVPIGSDYADVSIPNQPFHSTILHAIWRHAAATPNRSAFINADDDTKSINYAQLYLEAYSCATFLDKHQFGHGDIAAVVIPNCWQFVSILLGAALCGGAISGASYLFTDYELGRQFIDSKCKVVLTADVNLQRVLNAARKCPQIKTIIVLKTTNEQKTPIPSGLFDWHRDVIQSEPNYYRSDIVVDIERDVVILPYSSGTTGPPKGVMLTHRNMNALDAIYRNHFDRHVWPYTSIRDWTKEITLLYLPFYHMYGCYMMLNAIINGSTGIIFSRFDAELFFRSIEKYKVHQLALVPPILVQFAKSPIANKYDLSSICFILSRAAPAGRELCEDVRKRFPNIKHIVQVYGMTEKGASHYPDLGLPVCYGSVGRLGSNFERKIISVDTGKECDYEQHGELLLRGPSIMAGYLNRPEATAETFDADGWLHTGDIVYLDKAGNLFIVDRIKELIKVSGFQVAPAEIEDILLSHPDIRDAAVIGIPDEKSGELPKAYVVRANEKLTEKMVIDFVKSKVSNHKELKGGVEFVKEIPKSAAGKILRRMLRDRAAQSQSKKNSSKI